MCLLYTFHYGKYQTDTKDEESNRMNPYLLILHCQVIMADLVSFTTSFPFSHPRSFFRKFQIGIVFHKSVFNCYFQSSFTTGSHVITSHLGHFHLAPAASPHCPLCSIAPWPLWLSLFLGCFTHTNNSFFLLFTPQLNLQVLIYFDLIF